MQYEKTPDGKFFPLKQKNVDTGMGVERTTAVLNGKNSVFDIDEFKKIIDEIGKIAASKDLDCTRVVADHLRSAVFILGDKRCITPSNVDQGYVLRKLIRRAIRKGRSIGINKPFLVSLSETIINEYCDDYPELLENQGFIEKYLSLEEERFLKILNEGQKDSLKMINGLSDIWEEIELSGAKFLKASKISFDLFQSHGYPIEMFLDDLKENKELNEEIAERIREDVNKMVFSHQDVSRKGAEKRFKGGLSDDNGEVVRYHTATHLLNTALRKVLGDHVRQIGSNITSDRLRFDFPNPSKLSDENIREVEKIVNEIIDRDIPVNCRVLSQLDAIQSGATHLEGEKYPDQVKVYFIGDTLESSVSKEFCGGPHVSRTGEIGHIEIFKQDKIGDGKMRIYARFR